FRISDFGFRIFTRAAFGDIYSHSANKRPASAVLERKLEDQPVTQHPVGGRYSFHGFNGSVRAEHGVVIFPELPGHFEREKVKVSLADELFFSLLEKTLKWPVVIDEPALGVFHESDGRAVVHKRMKALLFFFQILLGLLPLSNVRDNPVK